MARPREFDPDQALDAAVSVFREHGFAGTSAQMLVDAMAIGRQSLYDAFGDKWQLYRAAVRRYAEAENTAHLETLQHGSRAIEGIEAMLQRVATSARDPCLGVGSICEFGTARPDLSDINAALDRLLTDALAQHIGTAQAQGDIARHLEPKAAAAFLISSIAGIRIAGRGGADQSTLVSLAAFAVRALR